MPRTYDDLASDNQFLTDGLTLLRLSGETVAPIENTQEGREELRDDIVSENRWNTVNLGSVLELGKNVHGDDVDPKDLEALGRAMSTLEEVPDFYKEGGAPAFETIWDYTKAAIADPTNIAGAVLGSATFGFSGAASLAAKQAAKGGLKSYIKTKAKLAVSAPVLKAAAVESGITGVGGAYRSTQEQKTRVTLGLKGEVDPVEALMTGVLEGPLSVFAGGVVATSLGAATKAVSESAVGRSAGAQWMKNNLLPKSANDAISNRLAEEFLGKSKMYQKEIDRLGKLMETQTNRFHKRDKAATIDNINAILDGNADAGVLDTLNPKLLTTVMNSKLLIKEAQDYIENTPEISEGLLKTLGTHNDYSRNVYEVFQVKKRLVPFKKFIKRNPQVLKELLDTTASDPEFLARLKANDPAGYKAFKQEQFSRGEIDPVTGTVKQVAREGKDAYKAARGLADKIYEAKKGRYSSIKSTTEKRKPIPEILNTLWGKNYKPGQRVMQSIDGILKRAQGLKLGTSLADSLDARGLAAIAPARQDLVPDAGVEGATRETTRQAAARVLNQGRRNPTKPSDLVRLMGKKDTDLIKVSKGDLNPKAKYNEVWVTPEVAANLRPILTQLSNIKPLFDGRHPWLERLGKAAGQTQGVIKIGKTVLSPITIVRNGVGASLNMIGGGNPVGWIKSFARTARDFTSSELTESARALRELGVTGSSVDIGQILTRMGRDIQEDPGFIEKVGTFGLAALSPKTYAKAQQFYGGTDDFFKSLTYMSEYSKEKSVWDSLTPDQRVERLELFKMDAGPDIHAGNYLAQKAAWNTKNIMPVYSRVPAITEHALVRSIPVIGNFSAYPSEMFRNVFNIFKLGAEELEQGFALGNSALVRSGLTRMAAFTTVAGSFYVAAQTIAELEDTTAQVETLRSIVPDWDKYGALVFGGSETRNGRTYAKYTNLSYSNPYSPFTNVIMPTITALANGEPMQKVLQEGLTESAANFVAPYTDPSLVRVAAQALVEGDMAKFYKTVQPGFVKVGLDVAKDMGALKSEKSILGLNLTPQDIERALYPKAFGADSKAPEDIAELETILRKQGRTLGGVAEREIDLTTNLGFAAIKMSSNYDERYQNAANKIQTMLTDPHFNLTPGSDAANQMLEEYEEVLELDFVKDQQLRELWEDMVTLSGSKMAARKLFTDSAVKGALGSNDKLYGILADEPYFVPRQFFSTAKLKKLYRDIYQLPQGVADDKAKALSNFQQRVSDLEQEHWSRSLYDDPWSL